MKINELKPGDILAKHNNSGLLPKGINFFMKLRAKIHYKTDLPQYYNHMMIITSTGKMAEAVARGFIQREVGIGNNVVVFRPKKPLTKFEEVSLMVAASDMADKNIEYEKLNFFWWMPYILSNGKIDLSPKGDKAGKRLFCFEAACMLFEAARPGTFDRPDKVTSVDIQLDERFIQLELEP